MAEPSSVGDYDRIARLEQELSHVSDVLKRTERSLGGLQWALALLVLGVIAAGILVRNGVIDINQVFNRPAINPKVGSKGFDFFNRNDKRVLLVEDDKFGYPDLIFLDLDLNYKMGITMTPDTEKGAPEIALYGKGGARAQYRLGKNGESLVRLLGEDKKGEILMQVTRDGVPSLTMKDVNGKVLFHAPEGSPIPAGYRQSAESRR